MCFAQQLGNRGVTTWCGYQAQVTAVIAEVTAESLCMVGWMKEVTPAQRVKAKKLPQHQRIRLIHSTQT